MSFGKLYIFIQTERALTGLSSNIYVDFSLVDRVIDDTSIAGQLMALGLPEAAEVEERQPRKFHDRNAYFIKHHTHHYHTSS